MGSFPFKTVSFNDIGILTVLMRPNSIPVLCYIPNRWKKRNGRCRAKELPVFLMKLILKYITEWGPSESQEHEEWNWGEPTVYSFQINHSTWSKGNVSCTCNEDIFTSMKRPIFTPFEFPPQEEGIMGIWNRLSNSYINF